MPPPRYACGTCEKTFCKAPTLRDHANRSNHFPWTCPLCDQQRRFFMKTSLESHFQAKHCGESLYYCSSCTDCFLSDWILEQHVTQNHNNSTTDSSPPRWPTQATWPTRATWNDERADTAPAVYAEDEEEEWESWGDFDLAAHYDVPPWAAWHVLQGCTLCSAIQLTPDVSFYPSMHCEVCSESFHETSLKRKHYRDTRAHETCGLCNVAFKIPEDYQAHMTPTHIVDKAEACCIACNRYYPTTESLLEHVDVVHGGLQDDVIAMEGVIMMYFIGKTGDGGGLAFCSCCDRNFTAYGALVDHVFALHGGGKFGHLDSTTGVLRYVHIGEPTASAAASSPPIKSTPAIKTDAKDDNTRDEHVPSIGVEPDNEERDSPEVLTAPASKPTDPHESKIVAHALVVGRELKKTSEAPAKKKLWRSKSYP